MTPRPWEQPPEGAAFTIAQRVAAAVPEIVTNRLRLRAPRLQDYAAYEAVFLSERAAYLGAAFDRESAFADFCQGVAGWMLRGAGMWTLCLKGSEAPLGWIYLWMEFGDHEPELGWILTEAAEGNGYAVEAARSVLPHALALYGSGGVVSYIDPSNARSLRLAERLGARLDSEAARAFDEPVLVYRHHVEGIAQ